MRKLIIAVLAALLISIGVFAAVQSVQPDRAEAHFVSCYPTPDVGDWPFYGRTYYFQVVTSCSGAVPLLYMSAQIINSYGGTVGTYGKTCYGTSYCYLVGYPTLYPGSYVVKLTTWYYDDGRWWGPYNNYWQMYVMLSGQVSGPY